MTQLIEDRHTGSGGGPSENGSEHRIRFEPCPKRVRVYLGAQPVADSRRVMTMFETGHLPVYYFPLPDVNRDLLTPTDKSTVCPYKGTASYWTVQVGDRLAESAAWSYPEPLAEAPRELAGLMAFYWAKMDAWFEEDEEVYVHPRDPYKRIDVLNSSRHVQVEIGGEIVADTHRPCLLFETYLPTRYYIPKADVRMDLLEPTDTTSQCPYKGIASYYSVRLGEQSVPDVAWYYPFPTEGCSKITNMVCFFDEKVDAVYVDGERLERPTTVWSNRR